MQNKLIGPFSFIFFVFLTVLPLKSESGYTIFGQVIDNDNKQPIPGATIKVTGTNKGSYSSTRGKFRIPFLEGKNRLKIMSIGYKTRFIEVDENSDSLIVKLSPSPVLLKEAKVIGEIEANEVIKRAIERKKDNRTKLITFKGLLYSKMVMELDGSMFAGADNNSISLSASLGAQAPEQYKMFVMESFSRDYRDFEKDVKFTEIIQRRQTSNMQPNSNLLAIGNFFNLYDDEINFINVNFVTPLSSSAFDYYDFKMIEKNILDNRYIYVIEVIPNTDLFPVFKGMIKIVEGTYNLVELDLKPSESTAVTFVDSIHIIQKFDEINENIWYPAFLELTGKARVEVIKNLLDVKLNAKASSIYSEMEVNQPLPDSIYYEDIKRLTVAPMADSTNIEYWEKNSLRDLSKKEKQIYIKVDSLVAKADSIEEEKSSFNYKLLNPYFDFNRVGSVSIGFSPSISYKWISLKTDAAFSFGLQKPIGNINLTVPVQLFDQYFYLHGKLFSEIGAVGYDKSFHQLINSAMAALFHKDYYDYYQKDGWDVGISYYHPKFSFRSDFENSRCFSLDKNTDRSIFLKKDWRENPGIVDGNYWTSKNTLNLSVSRWFPRIRGLSINIFTNFLYGQNIETKKEFNRSYASLGFKTPTFNTGYNPLKLELLFEYGKGKDLPLQYQHKARTSMFFISKFGNFCTIPYGIYEKEGFFAGHVKYNLTDIWWRWIGLPLYEGRGFDIVARASAGKYKTAFNSNEWYTEAGIGFERIPTFISNVIYFGAGAVWGVGPIATGKSSWYLDITFPF
ncbi:DUF5686 family protein [Bacteroidota bacterium]